MANNKITQDKNQKAFIEATISLFKVVPYVTGESVDFSDAALMKHGLFVAPDAREALPSIGAYTDFMVKAHGYDLAKINNTFHKSFEKVKSASPRQLLIEQALHYVSVYLQNGLDDQSEQEVDSSLVYIPAEELELSTKDPVRVTVIHALSDKEIISRAKAMLSSGMALSDRVQDHLMAIVRHFGVLYFSLEDVRNKEFRIRMMDELGIMPTKAGDFVRYLVFKKTGLGMVVHSRRSVGAVIANPNKFDSTKAFRAFVAQNGVEAIAREFNRHRDFWVAMKHDGSEVAAIINKARRLSVSMNKPAKIGVLDRIGDSNITVEQVESALSKVTLYKKVMVANSLRRRMFSDSNSSLYVVRTGRSYATGEVSNLEATAERKRILETVMKSIIEEVRPNVEGLKINFPADMDYAFPVSEKKFVGPIPFFSTLSMDDNAVVGIHWVNVKNKENHRERVDLDLHYTSANYHVGWNTNWSDPARKEILHTGDLTDAPAPGGASEAIYVPDNIVDDFGAISLCRFTHNSVPVPYSFYVGSIEPENFSKKSILGAHELVTNVNGLEAENKEDLIGFIESNEDGKKFHFCKVGMGNSIVSAYDKNKAAALDAVKSMLATRVSVREILAAAGAKFELGEDETWDIDLSVSALTKDSFGFLTGATKKEQAKPKTVETK